MFITQYRAHSTTHNRLDTTIYSGRATYGMNKQENVCLHPEKKDHFDNEKKAMLGKRKTFFLLLVSFLLRERDLSASYCTSVLWYGKCAISITMRWHKQSEKLVCSAQRHNVHFWRKSATNGCSCCVLDVCMCIVHMSVNAKQTNATFILMQRKSKSISQWSTFMHWNCTHQRSITITITLFGCA